MWLVCPRSSYGGGRGKIGTFIIGGHQARLVLATSGRGERPCIWSRTCESGGRSIREVVMDTAAQVRSYMALKNPATERLTQARSEPVKLSRERWDALVASYDFPILGMYGDGSRFINVLEPRETPQCIFLPATYAPCA